MAKYDFDKVRDAHPLADTLRNRYGSPVGRDRKFKCVLPGHEDKHPSASILQVKGVWRWHCHTCDLGGDVIDLVCKAEGVDPVEAMRRLEDGDAPQLDGVAPERKVAPAEPEIPLAEFITVPEDQLPRPGRSSGNILGRDGLSFHKYSRPDWVFQHRDHQGRLRVIVLRWDRRGEVPKRLAQIRMTEDGRLIGLGLRKFDWRPLYNGQDILRKPHLPVVVVEGEKVANTLAALWEDRCSVVAWAGGSGVAELVDLHLLAGKDVYFCPDNDEKGIVAMQHIMARSAALTKHWFRLPERVKKGWDLLDALERFAQEDKLWAYMLERCQPEPEVPAVTAPLPDSPPEGPTSRTVASQWVPDRVDFEVTTKGELVKGSLHNISVFLRYAPEFKDEAGRSRFTFDQFEHDVMWDGSPMTGVRDLDVLSELVRLRQGLATSNRKMLQGLISDIAQERKVSSMAAILQSLPPWDHVHRLLPGNGKQGLMPTYTGCRADAYTRMVGARWMVGAVRRALKPGAQHDSMIVLEGREGIGKTSFLRILGRFPTKDAYGTASTALGSGDKDSVQNLRGKLIVELGEMTAHRKSEHDAFKEFLSKDVDTIRPSYGTRSIDFHRQCVFAGTTNQLSNYLTDPSGNRRIWPVPAKKIDLELLQADMIQIWAEAVHHHKLVANYLNAEEKLIWAEYIDERMQSDPWEHTLQAWLAKNTDGRTVDQDVLWMEALNIWIKDRTPAMKNRLVAVMDKLGWDLRRGSGQSADRTKKWRKRRRA